MGRKSDARKRILDSAISLISKRGFADVGVEEIMQAAGVGKSSFYHFFPSKDALGTAALEEYDKQMSDSVLDEAFSASTHPLERPLKLVSLLAKRMEGDSQVTGCLVGTLAAAGESVSDETREAASRILDALRDRLATALREAIEEHELFPNAPVHQIAESCVAYLHGLLLLCRLRQSTEPLLRLGPAVRAFWQRYTV